MCKYFSCIVHRNLKCYWLDNSMSHEDIIEHFNLNDTTLENREFIRIEIIPKDSKNVTRNKKNWELNIDEHETLPTWYDKNQAKYNKLCWIEWENSVKINIALDKEKITIENKFVIALDNSQVEAWGNSQVEAWGNSQVEAWGNSQVEAWDNSQVKALDNSQVKALDNSQVEAWGNSLIFKYNGTIKVESKNVIIIDRNNKKVILQQNSEYTLVTQ